MHGFLLLKSSEGKVIAVGDMIQVAHGARVRSRLVFHFIDGSLDDEMTVYVQRQGFQLLSDHHIQKGPSFPKPLDLAVDVKRCETMSRETKDGKEQVKVEHIDLPDNLANGMIPLVLEDIAPHMEETKVSYLAGSPKPRIVRLAMKPEGRASFFLEGTRRHAKKYTIHVEVEGIGGVVAPLIGKQPADMHVWVADGEVPTVIKTEGAFYEGGPSWTIEQTAPAWPHIPAK
jgi:hypothetical protein